MIHTDHTWAGGDRSGASAFGILRRLDWVYVAVWTVGISLGCGLIGTL